MRVIFSLLAMAAAVQLLLLPADAATRKRHHEQAQTRPQAQAEYNRRIVEWGFGGWPYTHNPFAQSIRGNSPD